MKTVGHGWVGDSAVRRPPGRESTSRLRGLGATGADGSLTTPKPKAKAGALSAADATGPLNAAGVGWPSGQPTPALTP